MKTFFRAVKQEFSIKKFILIILMLLCLVFICSQKDSFMISRACVDDHLVRVNEAGEKVPYQNISLMGDVEIRQTFTAQEDHLSTVGIAMKNPSGYMGSGTVSLTVIDRNGKKVGESSSLDVPSISNGGYTKYSLVGDTQAMNNNHIVTRDTIVSRTIGVPVEKGAEYTIILKSSHVDAPEEISLYALATDGHSDSTLIRNGKKVSDVRVVTKQFYYYFQQKIFSLFFLLGGIMILLILFPLDLLQGAVRRSKSRRLGHESGFDLHRLLLRIMFVLTPFYVYYLIAKISELPAYDAVKFLFSYLGLLNMIIIGLVWWLVYTVCNRTNLTIIITTFLGFAFSMANYLLILFRDSPLIFTDLSSAGTAADVVKSYRVTFSKSCLWLIMLAAVWMILAMIPRGNRGLPWKKRLAVLLAAFSWLGIYDYTFFRSDTFQRNNIKVSGFNAKFGYKQNGYALSFVYTIKSSFVEKPDRYSPEAVDKIMSKYQSDPADPNTKISRKNPNVIVIMNEALTDMNYVGPVKTNQDFMPFLRGLKENTIRGTMHTSIFGGSTADTEFEFLTGNTMRFLPFHSVPYNNMVEADTPSLTRNLKANGYEGNIAFHPGMKDSYNRNRTYPNLGFDEFVSYEKMKDPKKIRDYVSDSADFRYIIRRYEQYRKTGEQAPWYLFNVTIQNHAGFRLSTGRVDAGIRITDSNQAQEEAQQYLNLVKKSDDAYRELISYFQEVEEPTVIVTFGDHQPRVEGGVRIMV